MTRMQTAPNTIKRQKAQIVSETRWKAYGLISATKDKRVENTALCAALGLDPRGSREIFGRDPHFLMMTPISGRGLWWAINPEHPPFEVPGDKQSDKALIAVEPQIKLTTEEA